MALYGQKTNIKWLGIKNVRKRCWIFIRSCYYIEVAKLKVYLEKEDSGTYNSLIKPQVFKPLKENSELGSPKGSMVLTKVINKKSKIDNYRLRSWLSDSSILSDDTYSLEIILKARAK